LGEEAERTRVSDCEKEGNTTMRAELIYFSNATVLRCVEKKNPAPTLAPPVRVCRNKGDRALVQAIGGWPSAGARWIC
jgi:hypothetical protein